MEASELLDLPNKKILCLNHNPAQWEHADWIEEPIEGGQRFEIRYECGHQIPLVVTFAGMSADDELFRLLEQPNRDLLAVYMVNRESVHHAH